MPTHKHGDNSPFAAFYSASNPKNFYVLLHRVVRDSSPLGWTDEGTDLAIISNPDPVGSWTDPAEWTQQTVTVDTNGTSAAAAVVGGDGYVYIYTAANGIILVRAPLGQLNDIANQLEYFSGSTQQPWQSVVLTGMGWENQAQVIFPGGATEMSVNWHGPPLNE